MTSKNLYSQTLDLIGKIFIYIYMAIIWIPLHLIHWPLLLLHGIGQLADYIIEHFTCNVGAHIRSTNENINDYSLSNAIRLFIKGSGKLKGIGNNPLLFSYNLCNVANFTFILIANYYISPPSKYLLYIEMLSSVALFFFTIFFVITAYQRAVNYEADYESLDFQGLCKLIKLGKGKGSTYADQARSLNLKLGDTIRGKESNGTAWWHEARLSLIYLGRESAVYRYQCRTNTNAVWQDRGEISSFCLTDREWHLEVPLELFDKTESG